MKAVIYQRAIGNKSKGEERKAIEDVDNEWMQNVTVDLPNVDLPTDNFLPI
jgi:hypothetical protein